MKIAYWNIKANPDCIEYLATYKPDVFCLSEISSSSGYEYLVKYFPDHQIVSIDNNFIVGVRRSIWFFISARNEFKGRSTLRPGVLVTLKGMSILFLHFKAFSSPLDFGLRDAAYKSLSSLRRKFPDDYRLIYMGDFNTVGTVAAYNQHSDLSQEQEIKVLSDRLRNYGMVKNENKENTWWNGRKGTSPAKLDHVFYTKNMSVETVVEGWPEKVESLQPDFIRVFSDHAILLVKI